MDAQTPFMFKGGEGVNAGVGEVEWVVAKERSPFDNNLSQKNLITSQKKSDSLSKEIW